MRQICLDSSVQGQLGDFLIPQRGIFAIGSAFLESFDTDRHLAATSKAEASRQPVHPTGQS